MRRSTSFNRVLPTLFSGAILTFFFSSSASFAADFTDGMQCYSSGDYGCAVKQWQTSANQGIGQAQYNLALLYGQGRGTERDAAKAAQLLESAANMGIVQAQYNLALAYLQGNGVPKDEDKAISWFQKAADLGDPNAANNLGTILESRKDYENALKWYTKAAEAGIAEAEFNLGSMYDLGKGVKQDPATAMQWYQKAAEQGDAGALCNIGILFYNGEGVKMDRAVAYEYFLLAQKAGDGRASSLLQWVTDKVNKRDQERVNAQIEAWLHSHSLRTVIADFAAPEAIMAADARVAAQPQTQAGL